LPIEYENAQKRILEVFTVAGRCFDQLALALSPVSDGGVYSCAPEKTAGGRVMANRSVAIMVRSSKKLSSHKQRP